MITATAFAIIAGFGVFEYLCENAPVLNEGSQMPAEDVPAAAERA